MECMPSELARGIHENLPYVSNVTNPSIVVLNNGDIVELSFTDIDTYVRGGFWGAIIVVIVYILLFLSCIWCCMSCCLCCGERETKGKRPAITWCLGITNLILTFLAIGVIAASFWAEQQVNDGVTQYFGDILRVINNSSISSGSSSFENIIRTFEIYRHWVVIAFLAVLLLVVVITLLITVLAPLCKSAIPVIVMVGVLGIATLLIGYLAGGTFSSLVFLSDLCVDSYAVAQDIDICTSNEQDVQTFRTTLSFFCHDLLMNVFTVVILGCALVVLFVLLQAIGSVYAGFLINYFKTRRHKEAPPPNTGVWDSYGAQHVFTETSTQQTQQNIMLHPVGYPQHKMPFGQPQQNMPMSPGNPQQMPLSPFGQPQQNMPFGQPQQNMPLSPVGQPQHQPLYPQYSATTLPTDEQAPGDDVPPNYSDMYPQEEK